MNILDRVKKLEEAIEALKNDLDSSFSNDYNIKIEKRIEELEDKVKRLIRNR